jgi:hypothetical protein
VIVHLVGVLSHFNYLEDAQNHKPRICVYICWPSSGPSGSERKRQQLLTEWVPNMQERVWC